MRGRIIVAIVGLVAAALIAAGVGTLLVTRNSTRDDDIKQITDTADRISTVVINARASTAGRPVVVRRYLLAVIRQVAHLDDASIVTIDQSGTPMTSLPAGVSAQDIQPNELLSGNTVSGSTGSLVFAAVPITPSGRPFGANVGVVVITRQIGYLGPSWVYFVLVGLGVLLVAGLVGWQLSRRISRPVEAAVEATGRIAAGDLEARAPVRRHDYPELAALGKAIDTMARSLARSRDSERQFLMSVSHDLRTPLTSIRGFGEAIAEGATSDTEKAGAVIANEARRLERLVGDLLELANLDAKRFSLRLGPTETTEVLTGTVEGFRPMVERAGLQLDVRVPREPLWVTADPDRMAQVVANLVENAYNFARSRVSVGAVAHDASVVVTVEDDGPGIDPSELDRVFERLYQSYRTPARRVGSGLGLAIVSELVGSMGATVEAQSPASDGHGTKMVVGFPRATRPGSPTAR